MTKKAASKKAAAASPNSLLVSPLRTLLHTVRCVSQHEDALCTLLHNLQHHPENSAELTAELHTLLDELPSRDYIDDLNALHRVLPPLTTL